MKLAILFAGLVAIAWYTWPGLNARFNKHGVGPLNALATWFIGIALAWLVALALILLG